MIRIAAVGDLHAGEDSAGCLDLRQANLCADLLLLAGDLTRIGHPDECEVLLDELRDVRIPVVAVLGNHDYHSGREDSLVDQLTGAGIRVLEGDACALDIEGTVVGIAGTKGFGGGFAGACASDFGEPEMKAFIRHTEVLASRLERALAGLQATISVALLHYSPIEATLQGERLEIYPFLGSYLLAAAIDRAGADLVVHGHAHRGIEKGVTPAGIRVRNVAKPVIGRPFNVYVVGEGEEAAA